MALLALLYIALTCGAQWLVFVALGLEIDPMIVLVTLSLAIAIGALSGTPGGIATTEAVMVGAYAALGVLRSMRLRGPFFLGDCTMRSFSLLGFPLCSTSNCDTAPEETPRSFLGMRAWIIRRSGHEASRRAGCPLLNAYLIHVS